MSDEPTPTPEPSPLPEPVAVTRTLTYAFPNVLLGIGKDANGFVAKQVREGEHRQVEMTTTTTYSDDPQTEAPFVIQGQNRLQFGGLPIMVINDAVDLEGLALPATAPTASEYLALIGKDVPVGFLCRRDPHISDLRGKPAYRTDRTTVKLL